MDDATASEQQRLENEQRYQKGKLETKYKTEIDNLKSDLERNHRDKMESLKRESTEKNEKVRFVISYYDGDFYS